MKIIITSYRDKMVSCGLEGNTLELFDCFEEKGEIAGNVYLGRVAEIAKNIDACFVSISPKIKCFLNARDCPGGVLPRQGDEVVVRVKAQGVRSKLPACSMNLRKYQKEALEKASHAVLYTLLFKGTQNYIKSIKSVPFERIDGIMTDSAGIYGDLKEELPEYESAGLIRFYEDDDLALCRLYSINERVEEILARRVWMKSGAYLVVEHTETLHVIDVNTGKYDKKRDKDVTDREVNLEAAAEAARQIRLRNLSGIIIVDFINCAQDFKDELSEVLSRELAKDPMGPQLVDITPLYLAEITRRKKLPPVYETL